MWADLLLKRLSSGPNVIKQKYAYTYKDFTYKDFTYNDFAYNWFYLEMDLLITVDKNINEMLHLILLQVMSLLVMSPVWSVICIVIISKVVKGNVIICFVVVSIKLLGS